MPILGSRCSLQLFWHLRKTFSAHRDYRRICSHLGKFSFSYQKVFGLMRKTSDMTKVKNRDFAAIRFDQLAGMRKLYNKVLRSTAGTPITASNQFNAIVTDWLPFITISVHL